MAEITEFPIQTVTITSQQLQGPTGTDGRQVEFNVSGTTLQWRYAGDITWVNLFDIPQPALVFSPHLWTSNTEINLGDGSYGKRYVGTHNLLANARTLTVLDNLSISARIFNSGGWWSRNAADPDRVSLGHTFYVGDSSASPVWSAIQNTQSTGLVQLIVRGDSAATAAPYDVWIRYTK